MTPLNRYAAQCTAKTKTTGTRCQNPAVCGYTVCRMHGARGGAPKDNLNALRHGNDTRAFQQLRRAYRNRFSLIEEACCILDLLRVLSERYQNALGSEKSARRFFSEVGGWEGLLSTLRCYGRAFRANRRETKQIEAEIERFTQIQEKAWKKLGFSIQPHAKREQRHGASRRLFPSAGQI